MGARVTAAVAAYAAPDFDDEELGAFVEGASAVCEDADAAYVGGDLDSHQEFTVATAAVGETDRRIGRDGAKPGDSVVVTGTLGRSAAALRLFESGRPDARTSCSGSRRGSRREWPSASTRRR